MARSARLFLALALLGASIAPASAHSQDAAAPPESVHAVYADLVDLFYRPPRPADLLKAGWNGLAMEAQRRAAPAPAPLPDLPDDSAAAWDLFARAYAEYLATLDDPLARESVGLAVESAMADSLHEQHTHVLPAPQFQRFLEQVGGGQQEIGLGIRVSQSGPPGLIVAIAPGSPAQRAGLKPGDVILAVNGATLTRSNQASVIGALAGPEGTEVELVVDRGEAPLTLTVTRGPYYFPPLESRVVADGVGYLRLSDFVVAGTRLPSGMDVLADLDRQLDDLDAQGVRGLVLDLRDNGGGSLQTVDELLGRFLPETARTLYDYDGRGHESYELASGLQRPRQVPMAVLLNGGSASASEVTAAALREANRAVLVGSRTAGAVASSELLPLPGGGALQVAVAGASTPVQHADMDVVGVDVDVTAPAARGLDELRSGADPQIDAAVAALANAPPPPPVQTTLGPVSSSQLDGLLEAALPAELSMPTNDRLTRATRWQRMDFVHPNQVIDQNGGAPDPLALQQTIRARGYQGSVVATYGSGPGDLPAVSVEVDLYAAPEGAHAAASSNDAPALLVPTDANQLLGEETVAYRGSWIAQGTSVLTWRRGRAVLTVTYSDSPGLERPATLAAVAQLVDAQAQQLALP
jgi:carboxyl-terminal processing protease